MTLTENESQMIDSFSALRELDQDKKLSINSDQYPSAALELEYISTPSIKNLTMLLDRYEKEHVFIKTTCDVLRGLMMVLGSHDLVLASLDKQTAKQAYFQFKTNVVIASCSVCREDRDTMQYINFVKQLDDAYLLIQSRAVFDESGYNERSRKHITISETRHKLDGASAAVGKRRGGILGFLRGRGQQPPNSGGNPQ